MAKRGKNPTLEFLGTGTSTGIPVAGCRCAVCNSPDPHDNRMRSSVLIRNGSKALVVDTGPEFRIQCIRASVMKLDGALITHTHADHIMGFDDVRSYSIFRNRTLPVWGSPASLEFIRTHFSYIWKPIQRGGGLPDVDLRPIHGQFTAIGLDITPIPLKHGVMDIFGFRIGDVAYMTDLSSVPDESMPLLENLGAMIISAVRYRHHPTHLNLAGAKRLHMRVRPKRTLLTHITHHFTHKGLIAELPVDMAPAYDGMVIDIR